MLIPVAQLETNFLSVYYFSSSHTHSAEACCGHIGGILHMRIQTAHNKLHQSKEF